MVIPAKARSNRAASRTSPPPDQPVFRLRWQQQLRDFLISAKDRAIEWCVGSLYLDACVGPMVEKQLDDPGIIFPCGGAKGRPTVL